MFSSLGWRGTMNIISSRRSSGGRKIKARPVVVTKCCDGGSRDADLLKSQLHLLREEAETTRSKAQNARLRLLRLSEAAEKLRRRAAIDVQNGNENEARDLLLQKKKVTKALDRSKNRIDLLEELSSKIDEAISLKEAQLIGNLTRLEFRTEKAKESVHIISPSKASWKEDSSASDLINSNCLDELSKEEDSNQNELIDSCLTSLNEASEEEFNEKKLISYSRSPHLAAKEGNSNAGDLNHSHFDDEADRECWEDYLNLDMETVRSRFFMNGDEDGSFLREKICFDNFLQNIDVHLREIESDLQSVLKSSALLMENEEMERNLKVQQVSLILGDIWRTRRRIASIIKPKSEDFEPDQSSQVESNQPNV